MSVVVATGGNIERLTNCVAYAWAVNGATDTYKPVEIPSHADKSVQLEGTFSGATIVIEGSNENGADPTSLNYETLLDPVGNPISFTAAGLKQVSQIVRWIRPRVSAGTPGAITVSLLGKKT